MSKGVASVPSPVTRLRDYSLTVTHQDFNEAVTSEFFKFHNIQGQSVR